MFTCAIYPPFPPQGAKTITTFEILPEPPASRAESNPWPTWPKILRVDYGHEEVKLRFGSDPRVFNILSKEFLVGDNGHVTGIKTVLVDWTKDDTGRWAMKERPGNYTRFIRSCLTFQNKT